VEGKPISDSQDLRFEKGEGSKAESGKRKAGARGAEGGARGGDRGRS
jgi:hypothetical protein